MYRAVRRFKHLNVARDRLMRMLGGVGSSNYKAPGGESRESTRRDPRLELAYAASSGCLAV